MVNVIYLQLDRVYLLGLLFERVNGGLETRCLISFLTQVVDFILKHSSFVGLLLSLFRTLKMELNFDGSKLNFRSILKATVIATAEQNGYSHQFQG